MCLYEYITLCFGKVVSRLSAVEWPSRSPDLTPCDFFLWGYVKTHVFMPPIPRKLQQLRNKVIQVCNQITPQMITNAMNDMTDRAQQCVHRAGEAVEVRL